MSASQNATTPFAIGLVLLYTHIGFSTRHALPIRAHRRAYLRIEKREGGGSEREVVVVAMVAMVVVVVVVVVSLTLYVSLEAWPHKPHLLQGHSQGRWHQYT